MATLDVFPKGLYIEKAMEVAREELTRECDYVVEAENQRRFKALVGDSEFFYVPGACPLQPDCPRAGGLCGCGGWSTAFPPPPLPAPGFRGMVVKPTAAKASSPCPSGWSWVSLRVMGCDVQTWCQTCPPKRC